MTQSQQNPYQAPSTLEQGAASAGRGWKWLLFSFDGRIGRGQYWLGHVPIMVVMTLFIGGFGVYGFMQYQELSAGGEPSFSPALMTALGIAYLIVFIPTFWVSLALSVKRWHDRNKSGWWWCISLVPYIGSAWLLIECGCLRGTDGPNRFGEDPLAA